MLEIGYRVRPVTRYSVTRWHSEEADDGRCSGGSECCGEFDREDTAEKVALALAAQETSGFVTVESDPVYSTVANSGLQVTWTKQTVIRADGDEVTAPSPAPADTSA